MSSSTSALIIAGITIVLFVSQRIPLALAALIGTMLMMMAGILTPAQVCGTFGSYICVLLVCSSIIGKAVFEVGLADKVGDALGRCRFVTRSEKRFLLCVILVTGIMSMFVANIPVVALMLPIASAAAARSGGRIKKKNLIMAIGFASTMGGNGTLIGSSTNMTGQASLQATTGDSLGMFTMLPATLLFLAIMVIYYLTLGHALEKKCFDFEDASGDDAQAQRHIPFQPVKSLIVGSVFVLMMLCFLAGIWNFGVVAMAAVLVCVLTGCISWKQALAEADWNTAIVVGATLSFATALNTSGAGEVISNAILELCGGEAASPRRLLGVAVVTASLLSCVMANNAVVAVMIPIFCSIAVTVGSCPVTFAVAIICGCNICYATPISTSPITMTLIGGYRFNDYVKVGGPLLILSDLLAVIALPLLYPL